MTTTRPTSDGHAVTCSIHGHITHADSQSEAWNVIDHHNRQHGSRNA